MIEITRYSASMDLINEAVATLPNIDGRESLNEPTGHFFYDPWVIKEKYRNTVWETLLNTLSVDKGEARLIKLEQGQCYPSHADLDDRWHLSLTGNTSYLIDLEKNMMYSTPKNGWWYSMNAGIRHSAANFGSTDRIQLVVRQLLPIPSIKNPVDVKITLTDVVGDRRFLFDDIISPWLNNAFKNKIIKNFKGEDLKAELTIDQSHLAELSNLLEKSKRFKIEVKNG